MFNKFKQKIADGVEGVSAGRQSPLTRSKHSEVGRAQAQNNGRIDENLAASSDGMRSSVSAINHPLEETYMTSTPLEMSREEEPPPDIQSPRRINRPRRLSTSSNRSTSSIQESKASNESDIESSGQTENMSINELRELYLKQDRSLKRYKNKLSEVVEAYKAIQKEKEKLEGTLTSGQDKQLRRIKELKEIIELEQEGKRHLEESLRLEMGEKDDKIGVLETQIGLLKKQYGLISPLKSTNELPSQDASQSEGDSGLIQTLQDKIVLLNTEIDQLKLSNEQAHTRLQQTDEEKKTAIDGVMGNLHEILNEQEDLKSQVDILRDELNSRDVTILRMREDEVKVEERLRSELEGQIRETILDDLQLGFQEKEAKLKNIFADKVHDLQRVMEENEKQKELSQQKMNSELTKKNDEILLLKAKLDEWDGKETKMKNRIQKLLSEKEGWAKKFHDSQAVLEEEKVKASGHASNQSKAVQEKQDECNEQITKMKRTCQTKVYEAQDQLRKKTNELNETVEKHKLELESKLKECQQHLQAEHSKNSRKLEVKMSDMKKALKELRQKLNEKEGKCRELETSLEDALTEADHTKSLNVSLSESGAKVDELKCSLELMVAEISEWKKKYEESCRNCNDELHLRKELEEELSTKEAYINELLDGEKSVDEKSLEIQTNELNDLKTKYSNLEEELKALSQQLQEKVAEVDSLSSALENVNRDTSKEEINNELSIKNKDYDIMKEKCKLLEEEVQGMEYKHNECMFRLEESKNAIETLREEYELILEAKEDEFRELKKEMDNNLLQKDESLECVSRKLSEERNQEISSVEMNYEQRIRELNNDWKMKSDKLERQYDEYVKNMEIKNTLLLEKKEEIETLEAEVVSLKESQESLTKTLDAYENEKSDLIAQIEQLQNVVKESEDGKDNFLRKHINELEAKHEENVLKLEKGHEENISKLTAKHQVDINHFRSQLESVEEKKIVDFNSLMEKHEEDRTILLKQIEEQSYNLNQMNLICQQKDKEYASLSEKLNNEILHHSSFKEEHEIIVEEKLCKQEAEWREKVEGLERNSIKAVEEKEEEKKLLVLELKSKHREEIQLIEAAFNSKEMEFISQLAENENQTSGLRKKIEEGKLRLKESFESHEAEIYNLKSRENDAWSQLEVLKSESSHLKEHYEKEIGVLESKILEDKNIIEEMKFKVVSGESNSKEIDAKFSELHIEKSNLEQKIVNEQHAFEDKIRYLENEIYKMKMEYEEQARRLEDERCEERKSFESQRSEMVSKLSEVEDAGTGKVLEMKKKAEIKISKIKKEQNEKNLKFETTINEMRERVAVLEGELSEQLSSHEEKLLDNKAEYEKKCVKNNEDYERMMKSVSEMGSEIQNLKEEIVCKSDKIAHLEEQLDDTTVVKMDSLKIQKVQLDEEHELELKELKEYNCSQIEAVERKLNAKIEEKDFEHNSEIKQMMKQFHAEMGNKDQEIQQAIQDAIESAQVDERRIINEYDEQITELQKELHLREKEMVELQEETERRLDLVQEERETLDKQHQNEITKLEQNYQLSLEYLSRTHEEAMLVNKKDSSDIVDAEEKMNEHINEVERRYALKIEELEDDHKNALQSQEKKFRMQLKQAKVEMRKLLASKGASIPNGGELISQSLSNPNSDNEMEVSEVIKLKEKVSTMSKELTSLREREKCLAMQAEQAPCTPTKNSNRPATLHLTSNINDNVHSSPKSPQPLEFEYLRNILFNFMMGKQRKQMAKVLTAIVHFSPSQVQQILAKVEEQESTKEKKSSWL